jgi:hypothetical protein
MRHLLFILILSFSHACFAHKDTVLNIDEDGNMTGLPVKFTPAKFDRKNLELTIGKASVSFPSCIGKFFADEDSIITFSSSWYHDEKKLPAYVNIDILPTGKDFSYQLLFTLDGLQPITFNIHTKLKNRTYIHNLVIDSECKVAFNAGS